MARQKGSLKYGGRKPGTPNLLTSELRERIKLFLEGNFTLIERDFKTLEPEKRILIFERYLKFVLPMLQSASVDLNFDAMTESQLDIIIDRLLTQNEDTERT